MKSPIVKSTLREIKSTFGRYLAIIMIIALGVGFFAGLKVTRPAMLKTGQKYLSEADMYDFRLLSTLGYTDKEVEKLAEIEGVEYAVGSFSTDGVFDIGGSEKVFAAHSVTEKVNLLKTVYGKMPTAPDECVLDHSRYGSDMIGKTVTVTEGKGFAFKDYRVVGIVSSPYYLNIERGNTKLGDGTVNAFIYIPFDGFDTEVYSEVFVTLKNKADIFSEEYDRIISDAEKAVGDGNTEVSTARFDSIKSDALSEIDDAEKKYNDSFSEYLDKKSKAEKELADTLDKLNSAEKELADRKKALEDGFSQLDEAEKTLKANISEAKSQMSQLEAAGMTGTEAYLKLSATVAALEGKLSECAEQRKTLENGRAESEKAEKELAASKEEYNSAKEKADRELADAGSELTDAKKKIDDARADVEAMEKPTTYLLDRGDNTGYVCYDSDSKIVDGVAKVFPVFFFLVAALVCTTTMTRMVDDERVQIGTLKSLGYGSGAVSGKYVFYSGSAALIGCVGGFFLGTWLFPMAIWKAYGMLYGFAPVEYVFDVPLAVISLAAAMLCSVGSTLLSCRDELTRRPAELIRPKSPKAGKRILLERIGFIWHRLPFLRKVSLRNIFRYKRRLFMMILGIGGCTALVLTGFGLRDSIADIANMQFDNVTVYDYVVTFSSPLDENARKKFEADNSAVLSSVGFFCQESGDVISGAGKNRSVTVVASLSGQFSDFIRLHNGNTDIPSPGKGEVVLDRRTASDISVSVGDTVAIRDIDMNEVTLRVIGICDNYVYNYAFISYDSIDGIGSGIKTVYANVREGVDIHAASAELMKSDNVLNVTVNADIRSRVDNMMKSLDSIVWLVIGCAGALALVVLFNLSNINITERVREIATIKVLGFYPSETSAYVFRENLILTALGTLFGIPLGIWLHSFVISCIKIDMVSFDNILKPVSYLLAVLMTFMFAFAVELVMRRRIDGINMAESLKSAE